ncbi:MAG: MEDS domain-containing protein [Acidimicrobiia bacterium]
MRLSVSTGLPGVEMHVGDHICAFYRGDDQRDQILFPYLRAGLEAGDRCVCVLDRGDPEHAKMIVGEARRVRGQLSVLRSEDSYLFGGFFCPDQMLSFWAEAARAAFDDDGYEFMRAAGEMTWALKDLPGVELLVAYEAELNRFLPKYPQTILCLYDLEQFTDGQVLIDILHTHPKVLMSGMVVDNPWYVEPDQFLARSS